MSEASNSRDGAVVVLPSPENDKPAVLIIGGLGMLTGPMIGTARCSSTFLHLGYIGRYLALYIHENELASEFRLVDKVLPQLAWLAPEFAEACSPDKFMQADATRERTFTLLLLQLLVKHAPTLTIRCLYQSRSRRSLPQLRLLNIHMSSIVAERRAFHRTTPYMQPVPSLSP